MVRFKLISDGFVTEDGFFFDDLKVNVLQESLSIDSFTLNDFVIYPNPIKNKLQIETKTSDYNISVYSILGQVLFNSENHSGNHSLDFSNYTKGIYIMTIKSNEVSKTFKIVKD